MRRVSLLLALLLVPALLAACGRPRGGGGGGGGGDDDDDAVGPISFAETYAHELTVDIAPTQLGIEVGMAECTASQTATVSRDPGNAGCEDCIGTWAGPSTGILAGCPGYNDLETFTWGFEQRGGETWLWAWGDAEVSWLADGWAEAAALQLVDGALVAGWDQPLGEDDFILATLSLTAVFE